MDNWWEICPFCRNCDNLEDCEQPCAMAMSFLMGK